MWGRVHFYFTHQNFTTTAPGLNRYTFGPPTPSGPRKLGDKTVYHTQRERERERERDTHTLNPAATFIHHRIYFMSEWPQSNLHKTQRTYLIPPLNSNMKHLVVVMERQRHVVIQSRSCEDFMPVWRCALTRVFVLKDGLYFAGRRTKRMELFYRQWRGQTRCARSAAMVPFRWASGVNTARRIGTYFYYYTLFTHINSPFIFLHLFSFNLCLSRKLMLTAP